MPDKMTVGQNGKNSISSLNSCSLVLVIIKFLILIRTPTRWLLLFQVFLIRSSNLRFLSNVTPNYFRQFVDVTSSSSDNYYSTTTLITKCHSSIFAEVAWGNFNSTPWLSMITKLWRILKKYKILKLVPIIRNRNQLSFV